jgi:meiotic recombination protein SPO11
MSQSQSQSQPRHNQNADVDHDDDKDSEFAKFDRAHYKPGPVSSRRDQTDSDSDNDNDDGDDSSSSNPHNSGVPDSLVVIQRIEEWILETVVDQLEIFKPPQIGTKNFLHNMHCRSLTSVLLAASFCHTLLLSRRTTTTREVFYHFVTHFRSQKECDAAIWDLASILVVPRSSLGLAASPKGWFCGCIDVYDPHGDLVTNGRALGVHGLPITSDMEDTHAQVTSHDAECILVIEKEGVYIRLSEDKFFLNNYPSILVTGKGFPDVATRRWVQFLQNKLKLPVYGLCDCNPYGISVLHTYQYDQVQRPQQRAAQAAAQDTTTSRPLLDMEWIGLLPSDLDGLDLPATCKQQMTDMDYKKLKSLMTETHPFHQRGRVQGQRMEEMELMQENDYKVELEALNWKGMDFLCQFVHSKLTLLREEDQRESGETDDDGIRASQEEEAYDDHRDII